MRSYLIIYASGSSGPGESNGACKIKIKVRAIN